MVSSSSRLLITRDVNALLMTNYLHLELKKCLVVCEKAAQEGDYRSCATLTK